MDAIQGGEDPLAAIRGLEAGAERFETPCGKGRMVWRKWGVGPPVLLLHGGSGSWLHWLRTIPALAARHAVWAPDLPGMGESDMPPEPFTAEAFAELIAHALERLGCGGAAIDVVGFSMGAVLAVPLAHRLEGRVRDLVLCGANFAGEIDGFRLGVVRTRRLSDEAERRRALARNLRVMMIAHESNIDDLALHLYAHDSTRRRLPAVRFGRSGILQTLLPTVRVQRRVAAISGRDDQVIGHGAERQMQALAALRPRARYHAIEGAGHWVMYEGAQGYNRALLEALGEDLAEAGQ